MKKILNLISSSIKRLTSKSRPIYTRPQTSYASVVPITLSTSYPNHRYLFYLWLMGKRINANFSQWSFIYDHKTSTDSLQLVVIKIVI